MQNNRIDPAWKWVLGISALATGFLFWLIYFQPVPDYSLPWLEQLPTVNAVLNSLSAICIGLGIWAIQTRRLLLHKRLMLSAFLLSTLFLVGYLVYHTFFGDTPYTGTGFWRPVYFFILISHIILTIGALPLILMTFYFSLTNRLTQHKKIARITAPVWLYVSVTGVLVYLMLRVF